MKKSIPIHSALSQIAGIIRVRINGIIIASRDKSGDEKELLQ